MKSRGNLVEISWKSRGNLVEISWKSRGNLEEIWVIRTIDLKFVVTYNHTYSWTAESVMYEFKR